MQTITINELLSQGFTEDALAVKALQKSFTPWLVVGVGGFGLAFALLVFKRVSPGLGISLVAVSWCFLLLTAVCMYKARPKSRHTGKPLVKYKNGSPDPGVILEMIYVCPDSKTFSKRAYLEKGYGYGGGAVGS